MTKDSSFGGCLSPMSQGSPSLNSKRPLGDWIQVSSNELRDKEELRECDSENSVDETVPTVEYTTKSGLGNLELRKKSDLQPEDLESMHEGTIYPESCEIAKIKKNARCCGSSKHSVVCCCVTMTRSKSIILAMGVLALVLLILFFGFAIIPLRPRRRPIIPLTTAPPTTLGTIRVLLLGNFFVLFV